MNTLLRIDIKLLRDALASNGGGVNADMYSVASRTRLMKAGLIQWKPNSRTVFVSLLTITKAGKELLERLP
jgi:hypothetical protein